MGATIEDISIHLPKKVLTNKNLKSRFDDFDSNKIENKIGIKQRHIATNETTIDLAYEAGLKILQKHNKEDRKSVV